MKPFNLQEFHANPSCKIITRDGRSVKILYTEAKGNYPVIGLISNKEGEYPENFTENGTYLNNIKSGNDLFFAYERKKWQVIVI